MRSDIQLVILKLLVENGDMYGLELVAKSNGVLKKGTIYVTLDRLETSGMIESKMKEPPRGSQGPARRIYKVTGLGQRTLKQALNARSALDSILGLGGC